ncbi:MAG TPA: M35 family metallo-endopeptidase [Thermoanaerobaculia bacterium]|jgi:peptidyl-Lys metalloendopeptidase
MDEAVRGEKALTPSYVSCSTSRQSLLVTTLNKAQGLAQRSRGYLNAVPTASRSTDTNYKTWFGVYANQPYKVHLCGAFWSAPATGTDSKAGTLIHEISHFTVERGRSLRPRFPSGSR